jgi:hypothetical protein
MGKYDWATGETVKRAEGTNYTAPGTNYTALCTNYAALDTCDGCHQQARACPDHSHVRTHS